MDGKKKAAAFGQKLAPEQDTSDLSLLGPISETQTEYAKLESCVSQSQCLSPAQEGRGSQQWLLLSWAIPWGTP
jgi:hypothetical protein